MLSPSEPPTSNESSHVLVTGGAGYIGSLLTGILVNQGYQITAVDDLLFGRESQLGYWHHPDFRFSKADACDSWTLNVSTLNLEHFDAVVHVAGIVGFPACQAAGGDPVRLPQCGSEGTRLRGGRRAWR